MKFTKNELEVMNIIWSEKCALSNNDIIELSVNPSWKPKSIHSLLNGLLKKDAIKVEGMKLSCKNFARTFIPNITKEEYMSVQAENILYYSDNSNLVGVISTLLKDKKVTRETLGELQKILDKMEKEIVD